MQVNLKQIADILSVSESMVRRWCREDGMPCIARGTSTEDAVFDVKACVAWRFRREREAARKGDARAAYLAARTKAVEVGTAKKLGELVLASDVAAKASATGRRVRDAMLAIPDKVAGPIAAATDSAEVYKLLMGEITAALNGMHDEYMQKAAA